MTQPTMPVAENTAVLSVDVPPTVRVVTAEEPRSLVRYEDAVEPIAQAFRDTSAGRAENQSIVMFPAERRELGDVLVKTGVIRGSPIHIVKISPWFAANVERSAPQGGFVAVLDTHTGYTLAILHDEHYLSDIRTAAAGAVVARLLAPETVRTAAVLGAGVQAYWQSLALYRERPFTGLLIWARDYAKAERLKARLANPLAGVDIEVWSDREALVRTADVIVTATQSREPLILGSWLREGQHVTALGADDPTKCEVDGQALTRGKVFVDSIETTSKNGDVFRAVQRGSYSLNKVAGEIGQVLNGDIPGRTVAADITIAKLVGIGAQDVVTASLALAKLVPVDDRHWLNHSVAEGLSVAK